MSILSKAKEEINKELEAKEKRHQERLAHEAYVKSMHEASYNKAKRLISEICEEDTRFSFKEEIREYGDKTILVYFNDVKIARLIAGNWTETTRYTDDYESTYPEYGMYFYKPDGDSFNISDESLESFLVRFIKPYLSK